MGMYKQRSQVLRGVAANVRTLPATSVDQTVKGMQGMVRDFYTDLAPYADWTLEDFYDMVKNLPYKMEPPEWRAQIIQRPKFTLQRLAPVVACANKAVLISSFLRMMGIPNGFVVSANSPRENFGHVFNYAMFPACNGSKSIIDATYPTNVIFFEKSYPKRRFFPCH